MGKKYICLEDQLIQLLNNPQRIKHMKTMKLLCLTALLVFGGIQLSKARHDGQNGVTTYLASIQGLKTGNIDKLMLMGTREVKIISQEAGKSQLTNLEVVSYAFAIVPKKINDTDNPSSYLESGTGSKLSHTMIDHIRSLRNGDLVVIGTVTVKMPDGSTVMASGCTYTAIVSN